MAPLPPLAWTGLVGTSIDPPRLPHCRRTAQGIGAGLVETGPVKVTRAGGGIPEAIAPAGWLAKAIEILGLV